MQKARSTPSVNRPKDIIASFIKGRGKSSVPGGNRLTLPRDVDGDGRYEVNSIFAEGLNAPYGLALVSGVLYVANQDEVVRFVYRDGQTKANGPPVHVSDLPSAINHHWTKAMTASPDGRFLYVGIGSNSNITERGMDAEIDRAMIWQIDAQTGAHRQYATGLRNPTALVFQPRTNQLWAVVNERDEVGPIWCPTISRRFASAVSMVGRAAIGVKTSMSVPNPKILKWSLRRSGPTTASNRMSPLWASRFRILFRRSRFSCLMARACLAAWVDVLSLFSSL